MKRRRRGRRRRRRTRRRRKRRRRKRRRRRRRKDIKKGPSKYWITVTYYNTKHTEPLNHKSTKVIKVKIRHQVLQNTFS